MSVLNRLFGNQQSDATETTNTIESDTQDSHKQSFEWLDQPLIAYDMTREQNFSFPEEISIYSKNGETATICITTPTTELNFTVRLADFTSRFGELDVMYISVGGYAINLYHKKPDSDDFFVRRLYYYEDENGIGGEQHRDSATKPTSYNWSRDDVGTTITCTATEAHLRVYDWREQMLTHDKPTPKTGEVIFRYQDSPNKGGNRDRKMLRLTVSDIQFASGQTLFVEFIQFDTETGELVLYGQLDEKWAVGRISISSTPKIDSVSWTTTETFVRASQLENIVWVREPNDTWAVEQVQNKKRYIN